MYAEGLGVEHDYVQAYMFFIIAATNGCDTASENLIKISELMTPEQIDKAQDRAKKWMEKHSH